MDRLRKRFSRQQDSSRETLDNGNLPVDQQIRHRWASALTDFRVYRRYSSSLRCHPTLSSNSTAFPTPSARRATCLDSLAFLEMSALDMTNSMKVLDDSIAHSKQARDDILPTNDQQIISIYHNLGYSLSHRAATTKSDLDPDEAIHCGRQVVRLTSSSSAAHVPRVNLASRLQTRYKIHHRPADVDEATSLLDGLMRNVNLESVQYGTALSLKVDSMPSQNRQCCAS